MQPYYQNRWFFPCFHGIFPTVPNSPNQGASEREHGNLKTNPLAILAALAFALAAASCVSTPAESPSGPNPYAFLDSLKLEDGQVVAKDMIDSASERYDLDPYSAANLFFVMDEWFDFSGRLGPEGSEALFAALFKDLPSRADSGDLRTVVVGDFYAKDSDLIIVIDRVGLVPGKVEGRDFAIRYFTNSAQFKATDKATGVTRLVSMGKYMTTSSCYYRLGVPYADGSLVYAGDLSFKPADVSAAAGDMDKANLIDTLVNDEFPANDDAIPAIYDELMAKPDLDPLFRLVAKANWWLYLLKRGEYARAAELRDEIAAMVPADADPSVVKAMTVDLPLMLELCRSWETAAVPWLD